MSDFWGVVIDQSLKNKGFINELNVLAKRQVGAWGLLLISLSEHELDDQIAALQSHMIDVKEDCWYAHFFRDNDLIAVYQNRTFAMTIDPETWCDSIRYGLDNGIPIEQLDFKPRTKADAATYFGVTELTGH